MMSIPYFSVNGLEGSIIFKCIGGISVTIFVVQGLKAAYDGLKAAGASSVSEPEVTVPRGGVKKVKKQNKLICQGSGCRNTSSKDCAFGCCKNCCKREKLGLEGGSGGGCQKHKWGAAFSSEPEISLQRGGVGGMQFNNQQQHPQQGVGGTQLNNQQMPQQYSQQQYPQQGGMQFQQQMPIAMAHAIPQSAMGYASSEAPPLPPGTQDLEVGDFPLFR
jgi:hypothetical protein